MKKWVSLSILVVCLVLVVLVSAAGAPPPPGGAPPPPPPPGAGSEGGTTVGPVGVGITDVSSYYPLKGWYGEYLRVMKAQEGTIILAELEFPSNLLPAWAVDLNRVSWVVWPSSVSVMCEVNVCNVRVGDIVDVTGIITKDGTLLAVDMRVVVSSSP